MPSYIMIENTPGYLPEDDDPFISDDYAAVVAYMNQRVEEYVEYLQDDPDVGPDGVSVTPMASSGNYAAVHVTCNAHEHDLGRWFSVEICEDCEEGEES